MPVFELVNRHRAVFDLRQHICWDSGNPVQCAVFTPEIAAYVQQGILKQLPDGPEEKPQKEAIPEQPLVASVVSVEEGTGLPRKDNIFAKIIRGEK